LKGADRSQSGGRRISRVDDPEACSQVERPPELEYGTVQTILRKERAEAEAIVRALVEAGLAVPKSSRGMNGCATTQLARSFGSQTAARPITRQTADHVLSQLLERVNQVNSNEYFLAKVTKVVVLGSYLRTDADRLSDLDIAVELQPKEAKLGPAA